MAKLDRVLRVRSTFRGAASLAGAVSVALSGVCAAEDAVDSHTGSIAASQVALLAPAVLEKSGAKIGAIRVLNGNVFDLDDPDENRRLFRWANALHITTRPDVIEQQLLFEPGDEFVRQEVEESERILRGRRYIQEVSITPVNYADGVVDLDVSTMDTWTLMPRLSLSRSGGKNKGSVGLKEMNLLGRGTAVELLFKSEVDRDSKVLKVVDNNIGKSWYGVTALYSSNSDGFARLLEVEKPFYSLQSTDARRIAFFDDDQIESLYDQGDIVASYRHEAKQYEVSTGWSKGLENGWARRFTAGVAYEDHRYSDVDDATLSLSVVPESRKLVYPFIEFELVEDAYEKTSNVEQINRVEDFFYGTRLNARLGLAQQSAGSDRDAWIFGASAQTGFGSTKDSVLLLAAKLDSRWEGGAARNLKLSAEATYFKRQSDHRAFFATLSGTYGRDLDLDQYFMLGGEDGLRGYPLRYQIGDKRALLTFEQRYFTDWYPFRLFRIGGAVFADIGRAWGNSPFEREDTGLLKDVGVGLRIGNARSGLGRMTHIDLAMPLDGGSDIKNMQFVVSTKKSF